MLLHGTPHGSPSIPAHCPRLAHHPYGARSAATDLGQDAINAAAAGFVLLSIANFALIIILAKDFGVERSPAYHQAPNSYNNNANIMQFQTSAPV